MAKATARATFPAPLPPRTRRVGMDAARLAEALDAHGVTVSQLARESSVNRSLLSKIVNGHRQPGKWTTWALNSALSRLGISEREVYDDVAD